MTFTWPLTWRLTRRRERAAWEGFLSQQPLGPQHRLWQRYVRGNNIYFPPQVAQHILDGDAHLLSLSKLRRDRAWEDKRWAIEASAVGDVAFHAITPRSWAISDPAARLAMLKDLNRQLEAVFFGNLNRVAASELEIHYDSRSIGLHMWEPRDDSYDVRRISIAQRLLTHQIPFTAVATVIHERFHDHQRVHSSGGKASGHLDARKMQTFAHGTAFDRWFGRYEWAYRLTSDEQDAWASEALAMLRYALRTDSHPSHQEDVDLRGALGRAVWRHLPYYTPENPPPPLDFQLLDDD
jgi:hypothetical protein